MIQIYPDGFLPIITPDVDDLSAAGGATLALGDWDMDASLVYGNNKMDFTIENTLNRSLGAGRPRPSSTPAASSTTSWCCNFSGVRQLRGRPRLAAERRDRRRGAAARATRSSPASRTATATAACCSDGTPTAVGRAGVPGLPSGQRGRRGPHRRRRLRRPRGQPHRRSCSSRSPCAPRTIRTSAATSTGKLAARYDFNDAFALRGSVQNGFRAPSLQQQFFTTTSTNFIGGVPFDITTFPVTDPVAQRARRAAARCRGVGQLLARRGAAARRLRA